MPGCKIENECEVLRKRNIKVDEIPDNEKITNESIKKKFKISRTFGNPWRIYKLQVNGST